MTLVCAARLQAPSSWQRLSQLAESYAWGTIPVRLLPSVAVLLHAAPVRFKEERKEQEEVCSLYSCLCVDAAA